MMSFPLLEVNDISVEYEVDDRIIKAVNHVNLEIKRGDVVAIVGESGSGKSTLAMTFLNLIEKPGRIKSGKIIYHGPEGVVDVLRMKPADLRRYRWKEVSIIFQSAMNSLNPVMRIEDQLRDVMIEHGIDESELDARIDGKLKLVGLPTSVKKSYPHELSGGMKQRVNIALALACDPKLIIADEATTALDVVVQKQILTRLLKLKQDLSLSLIFITHDISLVANIAETINVMYAGKIVERAETKELFEKPLHPYTQALLNSIPTLEKGAAIKGIKGTPPDLSKEIRGCSFAERCPKMFDRCLAESPELKNIGENHFVSCHIY
ncbi:MAG: ABC transporter ATP-binding protein [Nitrososphaerota archaeon]